PVLRRAKKHPPERRNRHRAKAAECSISCRRAFRRCPQGPGHQASHSPPPRRVDHKSRNRDKRVLADGSVWGPHSGATSARKRAYCDLQSCLSRQLQWAVGTAFSALSHKRFLTTRQPCWKIARRIERAALRVRSHGAVYFYHRRRGFLTRQGSRIGGAWRALTGARIQNAAT